MMPLNIKDDDTHEFGKKTREPDRRIHGQGRQARHTGKAWRRWRRCRAGPRLADELDRIALYCAKLPRRDKRSSEEIIGYDESGLPA